MVPFAHSRQRLVAALLALVALAAVAALALLAVQPPAAQRADAPATTFSAERAFVHVRAIADEPHDVGSPANDEVRAYLGDALAELGLDVSVQDATGADAGSEPPPDNRVTLARVRNVVGLLPGTASTGRLFLVAHYDSVQNGPGASDDGAGVSTVLETVRALTAGPRLRNDLVVLFTDGEEACLCGAEAFVGQHPLAEPGGVVINVEARGTGGPVIMFETSRRNAGLISVFGRHAAHPVGTSFAVEVYRLLPNDTDFTPFRMDDRFTGLNSAYIDGSAAYHTPADTPERMDRGSLQHHGDNALGLARALGAADLAELAEPSAVDATYFPAPGLLVRYPGWLVWPLAALAGLAVLATGWLARVRGLVSWPRLAAAFGLGLVPIVLAPVAAQLLWAVLVALRPGYANMIDPWRPGWFRWAVVALVAAVLLTWYGLSRRLLGSRDPASLRDGSIAAALGALGWLAMFGLALAALTPGGSYLGALPALFGAGGLALALVLRPLAARVAAVTVAGLVAVIVLAPTVLLFFPALGLAAGAAAALFAVLLGLALLPVIELLYPLERHRLRGAAPAVAAAAVAAACLAAGLGVDSFDARHPAPSQLMYAMDADTGEAHWVSAEPEPGAWTRRFVTGRENLGEKFPLLDAELSTGPAATGRLAPPELTVVSDLTNGDERTLRLRLTPQREVRLVYLRLDGVPLVRARVAGRDLGSRDGAPFAMLFHAPPATGVDVELVVRPTADAGPVLRYLDGSTGLDGLPGFTPRPADVGIIGDHFSELALVARTLRLPVTSPAPVG